MKKAIGIIILAAGNSSRLGQPKQLLDYKGKNLLVHVATEALLAKANAVVIVTGANRDAVEKELNLPGITFAYNEAWTQGMGSSIKKGLEQLLVSHPSLTACIVAVCDQPFVNANLFRKLIEVYMKTGKPIVASSYAETRGTPVLFDSIYFNDLLSLSGKEGAKKLLQHYKSDLTTVAFEKGEIDIDTPEDYQQLNQMI